MLNSFAKSHIGQRKNNEDSILVEKEIGLYIVADGVGGLNKGDVASQLACDIVHDSIIAGETLKEAIYIAHRSIISQIKGNTEKQGMATTIVAALFNENSYEIAWVGDSRVYLWEDKLQLLTKDDSYVELLLENGHISVDELDTHPDRNIISQALGIERKEIRIHSNFGTLEKGQTLLICSDGLYTIAKEPDIINCFKNHTDIKDITEELVDLAVEKEGKDNISLIGINANNINSKSKDVQKPIIFREFDGQTGNRIVDVFSKQQEIETDPELIDQTTFTDLSEQDRNRLDAAAEEEEESESKSFNYTAPIILVSVLIVIALFFIMNNS
ncbi:MAG: PP2C family serine/threonine-protein phosphatase [Marinicellaceae bacterium]